MNVENRRFELEYYFERRRRPNRVADADAASCFDTTLNKQNYVQ